MTDQPHPSDHPHRRRNRIMLLALVAVFVLPILAAKLIDVAGQRPAATRQHGELLQPPVDLRDRAPQLVAGDDYAWNPEARTWRILVAPPADCGQPCAEVADRIDIVWRLLGRNADRVHVLWLGDDAPPAGALPGTLHALRDDPALRAALPRSRVDGVPVYVIDPNGFVILHYPPGFDAGGLRSDMVRLLKLQ